MDTRVRTVCCALAPAWGAQGTPQNRMVELLSAESGRSAVDAQAALSMGGSRGSASLFKAATGGSDPLVGMGLPRCTHKVGLLKFFSENFTLQKWALSSKPGGLATGGGPAPLAF